MKETARKKVDVMKKMQLIKSKIEYLNKNKGVIEFKKINRREKKFS